MDIFINTDKSPALIQAKATGSPLSGFKVKRGAVVPLSVTVLGSQTATGLRMGIKAKGNYEGDLLILAEADSGTQTELGTRFDLKLIASSLALNDALDVGEGKESSPATLAAMTEFAWMDGGDTRLTDTLQTTIINDIIRLATDAPEAATGEYPAPDLVATKSWVNSKQATADTAGFVMLGTDEPISGKNIRPVGKTSSGGLAVDVSGMSAYDVAVANGFVGTEAAWLASLKGERGSKGEQGEPGKDADMETIVHQAVEKVTTQAYETKHALTATDNDNSHHRDQGLHFEQILPLLPVFCAIGNKNAGNSQQNTRRERLSIRKSALFAIFVADSVRKCVNISERDKSLFESFL